MQSKVIYKAHFKTTIVDKSAVQSIRAESIKTTQQKQKDRKQREIKKKQEGQFLRQVKSQEIKMYLRRDLKTKQKTGNGGASLTCRGNSRV